VRLFCERALRIAVALCATAALPACTRTYDGTIVPEYSAEVVSSGPVPVYRFRKTDTEPPSRLIKFPPAPPPAVQVADVQAQPRTLSRRARPRGQPVAKAPAAPEKKVTCHRDNSDAGRIRVICD
jgi:hypothetical protein